MCRINLFTEEDLMRVGPEPLELLARDLATAAKLLLKSGDVQINTINVKHVMQFLEDDTGEMHRVTNSGISAEIIFTEVSEHLQLMAYVSVALITSYFRSHGLLNPNTWVRGHLQPVTGWCEGLTPQDKVTAVHNVLAARAVDSSSDRNETAVRGLFRIFL